MFISQFNLNTQYTQVTDPQQIGEGRKTHTYYRIDVRQGQYSTDPIASVRRRYSDFQWLFQRLHAEKPGAIVPIIPHTQAVQLSKRMSEELIEERRVNIESFLRRVQVHPELEGAPSLAAFFSPDAEVFEAAKKANPGNSSADDDSADDPSSPKEKFTEKAKHFFVKAGVKVNVARGGELEDTRDGQQMEEVDSYLNTLETHVKSLSKATLYLVHVSKETSTTMHELGQSLFGLHQTYDPESSANSSAESEPAKKSNLPSIKTISNVFASLSAINKVKSDENEAKVGSPMNQLEWSIKAARLAVKRRTNAKLTYNTYLQQIKNREASLEKLQKSVDEKGHNGNADTKISEAQTAVVNAKQSANKALSELDTITARVFREMDRFKQGVDLELRKLYVSHARVQVDYSKQLENEWSKMLTHNTGSRSVSPVASLASGSSSKEAEMMMI